MSFFTYYILSSAKYPEGCHCPRHGNRSPYGLTSPMDAYARGLRKIMAPSPPTSEFVGMASYGPSCFLDIMDDDARSDGSSIGDVAPSHCPSWSALWRTL